MPGITWPWKNTRSPPWIADLARQKWFSPISYMQADEAKEAICPPYSLLSLLRRTTVAIAFQRLIVPDAPFHVHVAGDLKQIIGGNGVLVRRGRRKRQVGARGTGLLNGLVQQVMRPVRAVTFDDVSNGILPFLRLDRVDIGKVFAHGCVL